MLNYVWKTVALPNNLRFNGDSKNVKGRDMSKIVILKIGEGNFEVGFPITLEMRDNAQLIARITEGRLVPNPDILQSLEVYHYSYATWVESHNSLIVTIPSNMLTHVGGDSHAERLKQAIRQLEETFNTWLNSSSLGLIQSRILSKVGSDSDVRFFIHTNNFDLQQLPWQRWQFFREHYPQSEISLTIQREPPLGNLSYPVNILVILGNIEDQENSILNSLNTLQSRLNQDNKISIKILNPASESDQLARNIRNELHKNSWDIVVYLGHSHTINNGHDGFFLLSQNTSLSPENNLRDIFQEAIRKGLKVVVCNSCDGLGLGRQLTDLGMPHTIVMKEPIAVRVAVRFLEEFLSNFLAHKSLQQSVKIAKKELQLYEYESDAIGSAMLPVIISNPEEPILILSEPKTEDWLRKILSIYRTFQPIFLAALFCFGIFLGLLFDDILPDNNSVPQSNIDATQSSEISLGEEILLRENLPDNIIAQGRQAFENKEYKQAIQFFKQSLDRSPNNPEIRIYYNNARAAYQDKNHLKIATSVPIGNNPEIAQEILRGIALFQQELNDEQSKNPDFHFLQVVIANDNNSEEDAKDRAEKFVKDRSIIAVIGHNNFEASKAAKDIYIQGKIVAISPTTFSPEIASNGYIYRMVPEMETFATTLSEYIREQTDKLIIQNPTNLICYDKRSGDNYNFADKYKNILLGQRFHKVVKDEDFNCNINPEINLNEQQIYEKIAQYKVNILMIAPSVNDLKRAVNIFKHRPEQQLNLVILGSPTFQSYLTLEEGKQGVENLVISVPWYDLKQDDYILDFWQNKINVWRTPMAYDATKVILTALRQLSGQKKEFDRELLNQVLRNNFSIEGMTGTVRFDQNGVRNMNNNPDNRRYLILQVKNGQFVPLAPIKSASPL
jgi:branched-chain amino acid transport system substrate-binding protein